MRILLVRILTAGLLIATAGVGVMSAQQPAHTSDPKPRPDLVRAPDSQADVDFTGTSAQLEDNFNTPPAVVSFREPMLSRNELTIVGTVLIRVMKPPAATAPAPIWRI